VSDASTTPDELLRGAGLLTLGDDPPLEAVSTVLETLSDRLNGAGALDRVVAREGAIRALKAAGVGAPARLVDAALSGGEEGHEDDRGQGTRLTLEDPEPWPAPVDGAELLDEIAGTFVRHLALPDGAVEALTLWTLHAHAHGASDVSPLLALTSPEKRCGKTTALHILGALVPRPLPAANVTAAALFRAVEQFRPTLLVDEADSFIRDREELRGILNSGHVRASAVVVRTVGDEHEARAFSTWAPKAVALIDSGTTLPDTLRDRSVVIPMRRRRPDEAVERLRLDRLGALEPLRRRAWRWARDHGDALGGADPGLPSGLHDRARDNWRPLLAIADLAGGDWPDRAREAARTLAGLDEEDDGSVRTLLLRDLRELFEERGAHKLPSREIVDALAEREDRPWPEWRRGKPLTQRSLASLLRPFRISPDPLWIDGRTLRGYTREALEPVWRRYVPTDPPDDPQGPQGSRNDGEKSQSGKRKDTTSLADAETDEPPTGTGGLADLADRDTPSEEDTPPDGGEPDLWSANATDSDATDSRDDRPGVEL